MGAELLPHPLWAGAPSRGGEWARTGCAPRRLVAVQPLVAVLLAYDRAVLHCLPIHLASTVQQLLFCCRHSLQHGIAAISANRALALRGSTSRSQPAQHIAHSTAHDQHTHRLSASGTHNCRSASPATEMANSTLPPCILSSVADLSCGWHADGPLVCAPIPLVSRSIHPPLVLPSSVDECAPLLPRESPTQTERNRCVSSDFATASVIFLSCSSTIALLCCGPKRREAHHTQDATERTGKRGAQCSH